MGTKERLERFLQDTPIKPVARTKIGRHDVCVADGFVTPDQYRGCEARFGIPIEKDKFPTGCFATIWHAEGARGLSGVAYYDQFHDMVSISLAERQKARVTKTLQLAADTLARLKK